MTWISQDNRETLSTVGTSGPTARGSAPCHLHATSDGHARYRADNHGHFPVPVSWSQSRRPARTHPANMPDKDEAAGPRWVRTASGTAGPCMTLGAKQPRRWVRTPQPTAAVGSRWSQRRSATSCHQRGDAQVRAFVGQVPQVNELPSSALRQRFKLVPILPPSLPAKR